MFFWRDGTINMALRWSFGVAQGTSTLLNQGVNGPTERRLRWRSLLPGF
jgi:hypothetical protein